MGTEEKKYLPAEARVCQTLTFVHLKSRRKYNKEERGTSEKISNTSPTVASISGLGRGSISGLNGTLVLKSTTGWAGLQEAIE